MLNIVSHRGNINQNHDEIPLYTHPDGQKTITSVGKDVEKLEHSYTVCKMVQSLWKYR